MRYFSVTFVYQLADALEIKCGVSSLVCMECRHLGMCAWNTSVRKHALCSGKEMMLAVSQTGRRA